MFQFTTITFDFAEQMIYYHTNEREKSILRELIKRYNGQTINTVFEKLENLIEVLIDEYDKYITDVTFRMRCSWADHVNKYLDQNGNLCNLLLCIQDCLTDELRIVMLLNIETFHKRVEELSLINKINRIKEAEKLFYKNING